MSKLNFYFIESILPCNLYWSVIYLIKFIINI